MNDGGRSRWVKTGGFERRRKMGVRLDCGVKWLLLERMRFGKKNA